jgi:hypothetical protein
MRMARKTEYERLVEQFEGKGGLPTLEEAARLFEERGSTQPAPGADNDGSVTVFTSKDDIPDDYFDFKIIGDDDRPTSPTSMTGTTSDDRDRCLLPLQESSMRNPLSLCSAFPRFLPDTCAA